jgi:hypothetical protein
MRALRCLILTSAVLVLAVPGASAASSAPRPRDVKATRQLVGDLRGYYSQGYAKRHRLSSAINAALAQISAGCSGDLPSSLATGVPAQRAVFTELIEEGSYDLAIATVTPLNRADVSISKRLDRLHWSKGKLNTGVRDIAQELRGQVGLQPTDFCADVKAAQAAGDTTVPPATTQFLATFKRFASKPAPTESALIKEIKPYAVRKSDLTGIKRFEQAQAKFDKYVANLAYTGGLRLGAILTGTSSPGSGSSSSSAATATAHGASSDIPMG